MSLTTHRSMGRVINMGIKWAYEKAEATIHNCQAVIERSGDDEDAGWVWRVSHGPNLRASGETKSFDLAEERSIKCAAFFNKEM